MYHLRSTKSPDPFDLSQDSLMYHLRSTKSPDPFDLSNDKGERKQAG
jgi:hypothetical protein